MPYPYRIYETEREYCLHFSQVYCSGPIMTFDGIAVRFRKNDFIHCCFESSKRNEIKDRFSPERAKRIDWIKTALQDPAAELYIGWDCTKKSYDDERRVCVVVGEFVVVIQLLDAKTAKFITAYYAGNGETIEKIRRSPKWKQT